MRGPRDSPPMRGPRGLPPHPRPPALVLAGRPPTTSPPSAGPAWTPRGSCGIHGLRAPRLVRAPRSPPLCRGLCGLRPPAPAPAACGPLAARGPMRRPRSLRAPRLAPMRGPRGLPPAPAAPQLASRPPFLRDMRPWASPAAPPWRGRETNVSRETYPHRVSPSPCCFPPERLHRAPTSPHGPHGSCGLHGSHRPCGSHRPHGSCGPRAPPRRLVRAPRLPRRLVSRARGSPSGFLGCAANSVGFAPGLHGCPRLFLWPTRKRPGRKCLASLCRGAATLRGVQNRPNLQCSSAF